MRRRFSIAGLLAVMAFFGIAFAALRYPTQLWVNTTFTAALAALVVAAINLAFGRGRSRAFWAGFLIAGGSYFAPYCVPTFREAVCTRLLSEPLLDLLYPVVAPSQPPPPGGGRGDWTEPDRFTDNSTWIGTVRLVSPGAFRQIGHSLMILLVAALGGLYAGHRFDRRETKP